MIRKMTLLTENPFHEFLQRGGLTWSESVLWVETVHWCWFNFICQFRGGDHLVRALELNRCTLLHSLKLS
jgi:hypothetical protein